MLAVAGSLLVTPSNADGPAVVRRVVGSLTGTVTRSYTVPRGALLAGVTWRSGSLTAEVLRGSVWEPVERGEDEPGGKPGTEPFGVGRQGFVVLRMAGRADGVAVEFAGDSPSSSPAAVAPRHVPRLGDVVTRRGWGADERLRSGRVKYTSVSAVIVHHTVTPNDYTREEAPSYVRAVYAYHTRSRGWSDIGYNLLVDKYGTVYEGRYGDFTRGVVGSHTAGYNAHTIGVSLLGNYEEAALPAPVRDALGRAGAWASDQWRFDPRTTVRLQSRTVSRVSGHRDLGTTACPGRYAYAALPDVRKDAWHRLAPVFGAVDVSGAPVHAPKPVTVRGVLDKPAYWTATITVRDTTLAVARGHGREVSVSWDGRLSTGLPAPPGSYDYLLTADDRVHGHSEPRSGTFEVGLPTLL
jgi:hypothetical protein